MSQVIAGLVGGALALLGVYLAQALTVRANRRQRLATLGAQYLAEGAFASDYLGLIRHTPGSSAEARIPMAKVPHMGTAVTAGVELSLLGGKGTALAVQAVAGSLNRLTLMALPDVSDQDWFEAMMDFGEDRLQLLQVLRKEIGRPVMSDDELGHDAPDIEDPRSTHTPHGPATHD